MISSGYTVQFFKKADQKNAYNLLLLHTHMSIFNKKEGKNKRNGKFTAFVTESSGVEIANILFNNMIPVFDDVITPLNIDPTVDTYESNEIRYIRKHWDAIQTKAKKVYDTRYDTNSLDYDFFGKTCCDFKKLEAECAKIQLSTGK